MGDFEVPNDITFNRGLIADPKAFAKDFGAESWLYLNGEAFASMEGGMSFAQAQDAVSEAENIVTDSGELTVDFAREHMAAIDRLPRPTLVTCRVGPRSSALVYLYAGLHSGATAEQVLARA